MEFQYSILLFLIPVIILFLIPLFIWAEKKKNISLKLFIGNNSQNLLPGIDKKIKIIRYIIIITSLILLIISVARPQKGFIWQETVTSGIDIVIAIDTSKSMEAIDVTPNRLTKAKMALLELSGELMGDRIALIPFAGSSFVMTPFTADYSIFNQSVVTLETDTIPKSGTNLKSAISTSEELFKDKNSHKILILVTDGEDLANQGVNEAKRVAENGVQIFTVGVGTKSGELIPNPKRQGEFLKDKKGNIVKSKLDETSLKEIAAVTGGDYRDLSSGGNGILEVYKEKLYELEQENKTEQRSRLPIDYYRWFLLPAILLLIIEFIIVNIRKKRFNKKSLIGAIFLVNITTLFGTPADDILKSGEINRAIELYKKEKVSPTTLYNLGTAYYKTGDFSSAIEKYKQSLKKATGKFQKKILYNLGNSYYRSYENTTDMNEKVSLLKESLKSYEGALALKNPDEQVQKNHDFVKEILDKIEEQQQDQEQKDQEQQDQEQQDQEQQDQEQQDQEQQDQEQQDQEQQDQEQQDQEQQDQEQQDQEQQESPEKMTKEQAEALLKALENEDIEFKILTNDRDNSYTGEW